MTDTKLFQDNSRERKTYGSKSNVDKATKEQLGELDSGNFQGHGVTFY